MELILTIAIWILLGVLEQGLRHMFGGRKLTVDVRILLLRWRMRDKDALQEMVKAYAGLGDVTRRATEGTIHPLAKAVVDDVAALLRHDLSRTRPLLDAHHTSTALAISGNKFLTQGYDDMVKEARDQHGTEALLSVPARTLARIYNDDDLSSLLLGREIALCLLKDDTDKTLGEVILLGEHLGDTGDDTKKTWSESSDDEVTIRA